MYRGLNARRSLTVSVGMCLLGISFAQSSTAPGAPGGQPPPATTGADPSAPASDQVMPSPSREAASSPDQANSATYPAPSSRGSSGRNATSSAHRRDVPPTQTGDAASAAQNPDPGTGAGSHQRAELRSAAADKSPGISSGMDVQSPNGKPLGTVIDVIVSDSGKPAYVVIADQSGNDAAIPYPAARQMAHDNKLVVEDARLRAAPKVPQSQLLDRANKDWQGRADGYWNRATRQSDGSG